MSKLTALSISIAVLGGIWAFLALGPLAGFVLVWAGFIAWACFFHTGADMPALQKTIVGMSYGAVIAGIALLLATTNPLGIPGAVGPAIYIAVTVFFLVIVARFDLLSVVPANVYGYAATAAFGLQTANAGSAITMNMTNPVLIVILSTILGAVFGLLSAKLAAAIEKKS
ncbi:MULTISPECIES: DUF1097 domain-containing protein [unclassified Methylophaga]|jgi:uncharacterized protein DUF1097|uniref:DUF1097 domain-containing protein n=1 Tax=unclassified Methylophaga TaxID=2629249 RepID=UPI000C105936|nr:MULTISPECIES: DUF1097 domain-containing protein [unclassified Methylophaga]MBL1458328.1 DUF1097 domain-containing protein [Methylophaga sp.]|tara:strand:+ start:560 stop:1069 length:510 start_codon:yes stop_codon:yes gene_type:complete